MTTQTMPTDGAPTEPSRYGGGKRSYPWRYWISQGTVALSRGVDFRCKADSLVQLARWACLPLGYTVSARTSKDRQSVMLTFIPVVKKKVAVVEEEE